MSSFATFARWIAEGGRMQQWPTFCSRMSGQAGAANNSRGTRLATNIRATIQNSPMVCVRYFRRAIRLIRTIQLMNVITSTQSHNLCYTGTCFCDLSRPFARSRRHQHFHRSDSSRFHHLPFSSTLSSAVFSKNRLNKLIYEHNVVIKAQKC